MKGKLGYLKFVHFVIRLLIFRPILLFSQLTSDDLGPQVSSLLGLLLRYPYSPFQRILLASINHSFSLEECPNDHALVPIGRRCLIQLELFLEQKRETHLIPQLILLLSGKPRCYLNLLVWVHLVSLL